MRGAGTIEVVGGFSFLFSSPSFSLQLVFHKNRSVGSEARVSRTNRKEAETVYEYSKFPTVPYRCISYYGEKKRRIGRVGG